MGQNQKSHKSKKRHSPNKNRKSHPTSINAGDQQNNTQEKNGSMERELSGRYLKVKDKKFETAAVNSPQQGVKYSRVSLHIDNINKKSRQKLKSLLPSRSSQNSSLNSAKRKYKKEMKKKVEILETVLLEEQKRNKDQLKARGGKDIYLNSNQNLTHMGRKSPLNPLPYQSLMTHKSG